MQQKAAENRHKSYSQGLPKYVALATNGYLSNQITCKKMKLRSFNSIPRYNFSSNRVIQQTKPQHGYTQRTFTTYKPQQQLRSVNQHQIHTPKDFSRTSLFSTFPKSFEINRITSAPTTASFFKRSGSTRKTDVVLDVNNIEETNQILSQIEKPRFPHRQPLGTDDQGQIVTQDGLRGWPIQHRVTTWGDDTVDTISLHTDVWGVPLRVDILQRVVRWQLAKRRRGTAKAKTRAEVSGGGRKPRPQKGQGASRQGSIRAPQWRGGGRVFPPRPRSFAFRIPKHVRRLALRVALATKYAQGRLIIVDSVDLPTHKTKAFLQVMKQKGWNSVLISDIELPVNLSRATSNITNADIIPLRGLNVYDILRREMLILTKAAAERIQKRLLNRTPHILKMAYKNSLKRQGISLPEVTTQKV